MVGVFSIEETFKREQNMIQRWLVIVRDRQKRGSRKMVGYSARSAEIAFGEEANLDAPDESLSTTEVIPENESGTGDGGLEIDTENVVLDMIQGDEPIETGSASKSDIRERAEAAYQSLLASLRSEAGDTLSPQARSNNGAFDDPPTESPTSKPTLPPSFPPPPMEKAHPFGGFDDKALNGGYGMVPQGRSNGGDATDATEPPPQEQPINPGGALPRPAAKDAKTAPQRPAPKTATTSTSAPPPPRPSAKHASTSGAAAAKDNGFGRGSSGVAKSTTSTTTSSPPGGPQAKDGSNLTNPPPQSTVATGRFGSIPPPLITNMDNPAEAAAGGPDPEPRSTNTENEGMDENADSDATTIADTPEEIPLSPLGARPRTRGPRGARPRGGSFGTTQSNPVPKQPKNSVTPAPKQPKTAKQPQRQQQPQQPQQPQQTQQTQQPQQPPNIQSVAANQQGIVQTVAQQLYAAKKGKNKNKRKLGGRFT
eukprot:CAMPEP_0195307626 /NCGR_PEP_ID=MMETSP0707-20130614/37811_1 /TAXON_ID=33640 /ORGANISM="Asterionellopsis glacialis, Strain CCMP134" /LENGTH=480 /DNA_ID=CAMNT_0040371879 /DNA_START=243 /DNA_END=1685 /DNA_ORIENTATION=-